MISDAAARIDDGFRALIAEMAAAWATAPVPAPMHLETLERASIAVAEAKAVAWAWANRVIRTAQALLILHDHEFDVEASPLLRSLLEHAVAIWWIGDKQGEAYQVLVRDRAHRMEQYQKAQEAGWQLNDEGQHLLQEAIDIETDADARSGSNLLAAAHRAAAYRLGSFHQAWLMESWTSHPTIMSALAYRSTDENGLTTYLHPFPKDDGRHVLAAVCSTVHMALTAYEQLVPDAFGDQLLSWRDRFQHLAADLRTIRRSTQG